MNKKIKWAIPITVLSLTCGVTAGMLAGCGNDDPGAEHTHSYTQWGHDDDGHWKYCPDDNAIDEASREDHIFVAGECECGATKTPVAEKKYGTVTGQVKLHKMGGYDTDYAGLTVDMDDDSVEITVNSSSGAFTVENAEVGKNYTLTVAKSGYQSYSATVLVSEENETVNLGESVLEYEVFDLLEGWDGEYHDFSYVNETEPYIRFKEYTGKPKTLNVLTKDSYKDIKATFKIKYNNSSYNEHTQGILLKFEDGSHVIVRYHNGSMENGNIQYCNNLWSFTSETTLFGASANLDQWGEGRIHTLTSNETAAIKDNGVDLTLVRKGGVLYTFFNETFVAKYELPEGYADKNLQVGYFVFDTVNDGKLYYDVSESLPDVGASVTDETAKDAHGKIDGIPSDPAALGETVTITVTADERYKISRLEVNGIDVTANIVNGKYTFMLTGHMSVKAEFVEIQPIESLTISVTGKKFGVSGNAAEGLTATLSDGQFTYMGKITGGKLNLKNVAVGNNYTLSIDGFSSKTAISVGEDGIVEGVTLEYDSFIPRKNWGSFDYKYANDKPAKIIANNGCEMIMTKDVYGDVMFSMYLGGENRQGGNQAIYFQFGTEIVSVRMEGTSKIQFAQDTEWVVNAFTDETLTIASGSVWKDLIFFTGDSADENASQYLEEYAAGTLKLSVLRRANTFYVFLDGKYIGEHTFDAKYATQQASVGICWNDLQDGQNKEWGIELTTDLPKVTVTDQTAKDAHGKIEGIPSDPAFGDTVELTVTADEGYLLSKLEVNGVDVTTKIVDGKYKFTLTGNTTVKVEFTAVGSYDVTFHVDEKWNADGLIITFKRDGETKTVTLGENAVIKDMYTDTWTATTVVGNMTVSLGDIVINATDITIDLARLFNNAELANSRIKSANLATGEIVYNTEPNGETLWLNTVDIAQGSRYFATKISLPEESKQFLSNSGDNQETFSIYLKVGDKEKNITLWWNQKENNFKFYAMDIGQGSENLSDELKNAFIAGDGFYIVWAYNAENSNYEIYAGLTPEQVTKIGEWDMELPENGTLTAIGFGDGFKWGGQSYQLNIQMNCGATLNDALNISK